MSSSLPSPNRSALPVRSALTLFGLSLLALAGVAGAAGPSTVRVNVLPDGTQANRGSWSTVVSLDGQTIAFQTDATNLDPAGDLNLLPDLYVANRLTGSVQRFRTTLDGKEPTNGAQTPAMSPDGRFIAFHSNSSNLTPNFAFNSIYLWDRQADTCERVNLHNSAGTVVRGLSTLPSLSADGRFVAFQSDASFMWDDLYTPDSIYLRDRQKGRTERIGYRPDGEPFFRSYHPVLSPSGRFVAFEGIDEDRPNSPVSKPRDVYVRDRMTGKTVLASVPSSGQWTNADSLNPQLSLDGRYVVFESAASNLVPGDTNGVKDVFRRDLLLGETVRVSVAANGTPGNGESRYPAISYDGSLVTFSSTSDNLVTPDTNEWEDVFVKNLQDGSITCGSPSTSGGNGTGYNMSLSGDGRWVAFISGAVIVVPGDTNGYNDVFLRDRGTPTASSRIATGGALCATGAWVAWTDVPGAAPDGYALERADVDGVYSEIARLAPSCSAYADQGLTPGHRYLYRVRSFKGGTYSPYSSRALIWLPPAVPTLTATLETSTRALLRWTNVDWETGYQLERSVDGGPFTTLATPGANVAFIRDAGLTPGKRYTYRISALNAGGAFETSEPVSIDAPPLPPSAPIGLTATVIAARSVRLTWTDTSDNETGFQIWRWNTSASGSTYQMVGFNYANDTTFDNELLVPGARYVYYIRAYNSGGTSAISNKATVTMPQ